MILHNFPTFPYGPMFTCNTKRSRIRAICKLNPHGASKTWTSWHADRPAWHMRRRSCIRGTAMRSNLKAPCSLVSIDLLTDVSEVHTASIITEFIALIMEAVSTTETSVNLYDTTWRNKPEDTFILATVKTWTLTNFQELDFVSSLPVSSSMTQIFYVFPIRA
jgi:hypothetical protein